jgi:hypothetical protein
MDCEFIRQTRHILRYEDFQDVQMVILPELSFDEQQRIENLIITPDKENQNIGKSILVYDLNQSIFILSEIETKLKYISNKLNNAVSSNDLQKIDFWEQKSNNYQLLLNELSDFISYLLSIGLKYDWKMFKDSKWFNLIEKFIPSYNLERILFDKHIQKPKGRPKTEIKSLHFFLTDKKYTDLIPEIIQQYRNSKPSDIHYMVFVLYQMNIFSSKIIEDKSSLHRCLVDVFGINTVGKRQGLSRKLNDFLIDKIEPNSITYNFHKQKIKSIIKATGSPA